MKKQGSRATTQGMAALLVVIAILQVRPATGAPGDIFAMGAPEIGADPPKPTDIKDGDASVSTQTGALQYSYAIQVPPGRNGMSPDLAISYSSQAPTYGGLAAGWTLSVPMISEDLAHGRLRTRSPEVELAQSQSGIDPKADDRFVSSLAGGRPLIAVMEPTGVASDVYKAYRAQNDASFARYERMQSTSPFRWRVRTTDGRTLTFGEATRMSGCYVADGYAPLTGTVDAFGNEIRYNYAQAIAGECDLASVTWGQNATASLSDFAQVKFTYNRGNLCDNIYTNSQTDYRSGTPSVTGAQRLTSITVTAYSPGLPGSPVHTRTITLGYDAVNEGCDQPHAPVRLLTSIQESAYGVDSPAVTLPPVTFAYNSATVRLMTPSPTSGFSPWPQLEMNETGDQSTQSISWGYRYQDDRWPTVESMFLDVDGDGLQDVVQNNTSASNVTPTSECSANWYRNTGPDSTGEIRFVPAGTITLPRLKWYGPGDPNPISGGSEASDAYHEGCALNGQVTAYRNAYKAPQIDVCHHEKNSLCRAASDPTNSTKYCDPGGTRCPPDTGGPKAPETTFRTYLAYRWLDVDSDGLPDLVASVQGDIDSYDIERGNRTNPFDYTAGETGNLRLPNLNEWPSCTAAGAPGDRCKQFDTCFARLGARACDASGCRTNWGQVLSCVASSPTVGCDDLMASVWMGPGGMPSAAIPVQRHPYERCEGRYPWFIYKNLGNGDFANSPIIKYQPVPLESSNGDSSLGAGGSAVTSQGHAILDFDGDGTLDAVVRESKAVPTSITCTTSSDCAAGYGCDAWSHTCETVTGASAWQVWLGDGTGGFGSQMYVFPTRDISCGTPACAYGGNALAATAGTWGQSTAAMAGLADVNGDGAQDHWLAFAPSTANAYSNIAFNYGDELHLVTGSPPTGERTTTTRPTFDWIKPGNDTRVCVPDINGVCQTLFPNTRINAGTTSAWTRFVDVDEDGRPDVVTISSENATPVVHFNVGGQFISTGINYGFGVAGVSYDGLRRTTQAVAQANDDSGNRWRLKSDLLDLDGDGIAEGVFFTGALGYKRARPQYTQPPRLLAAVHNGRGAHSTVTYAQMHDREDLLEDQRTVTQTPSATWADGRPKASPRSQWVVKSIRVVDDVAATDGTTAYRYKNPRFGADDEGRYGFRGFEQVTTVAPGTTGAADGSRTVQRYGYDVDWSGRLVATIVMPSVSEDADDARSIDMQSWEPHTLFNGAITTFHPAVNEHHVCANGQTESSCIAAPAGRARTTATYTAYPDTPTVGDEQLWAQSGSLLQAGTSLVDGDRQTLTTYYVKSASNQYFLREFDTTKQKRSGTWVTFAKSRKDWDANGAQTSDELWVDASDTTRAITKYEVDASTGNRTKMWKPEQWAANTDPVTNLVRSTLAYDARKLFVATEINELGHQRDYVYEYGTGTKLETLGPNAPPCASVNPPTCAAGALTKEDHRIRIDGVGRMIERYETFADPGANYAAYKVETNTYVDGLATSVTHQSAIDGTTSIRYSNDKTELDGHGRPIRKTIAVGATLGAAPADQVTTYTYRHDGTLTSVRAPDPSANDASTVIYTYTYDSLGRALTIRRPDPAQSGVNISYDGVKQTATEVVGTGGGLSAVTTTTKDGFGRLVQVAEQLSTAPTWATTAYQYDASDNVAQIIDPEGVTTLLAHDFASRRTAISRAGRTWSYTYDRNGNMRTEMSPCAPGSEALYTTSIVYDVLDRPTSRSNAPRDLSSTDLATFGSSTETYTWDTGNNGKGQLYHWESFAPNASTATNKSTTTWNIQGKRYMLAENFTAPGAATLTRTNIHQHYISGLPAATYYYDVFGSLCPSGSMSLNLFDTRGFPAGVFMGRCNGLVNQPASSIAETRNVAGLVTKQYSTNGTYGGTFTYVESNWVYDKLGRVASQVINKGSPVTQVARQDLLYNGNDDPSTLDHWLGTSNHKHFSFIYDARHQLKTVGENVLPNAFTASYSYGTAGRFTGATETAALLNGSDVKPRNVTYQYAGADPEQVTALLSGTSTYASYTYDLAGNQKTRSYPATRESWDYVYDGKNQLRRATRKLSGAVTGSEEYWYDRDGNRQIVIKWDSNHVKTETIWFIDETEAHYNASAALIAIYSYVSLGMPVARFERTANGLAGVEYQFHGLASNTLAAIDNATSTVDASFVYAPFGEIIESATGSKSNGSDKHRRRMNDKYVDEIGGLAYYGFRYYDSTSMTWTQSDPLYRFQPDMAWQRPRLGQLYSFTGNNPLRYIDPDGRQIDGVGRADDLSEGIKRDYSMAANDPIANALQFAVSVPRTGIGLLVSLDDMPKTSVSRADMVRMFQGGFEKGKTADLTPKSDLEKSFGMSEDDALSMIGTNGPTSTVTDVPGSKPAFKGEPGSTARGQTQSRSYGEDGYPLTDRDIGHPDEAGIGCGDHCHDWERPPNGGAPNHGHRGPSRLPADNDPPPPRGPGVPPEKQ